MKLRWKIAQAAEIRWWKQYLNNKPVDDYLEKKQTYWKSVLTQIKPVLLPISNILDAGCGPAGIFMIFPSNSVKAIDPLLQQYEQSLAHFSQKKYPWVDFECIDFESFSPKEKYDTIFCLNAINHVSDLEKSLDVLFDALEKGGQLIISTDAHKYLFLKKIFQWFPGDILHPHQYNSKEYEAMLTQRGGKIIKTIISKPGNIFDYVVYVVRK